MLGLVGFVVLCGVVVKIGGVAVVVRVGMDVCFVCFGVFCRVCF